MEQYLTDKALDAVYGLFSSEDYSPNLHIVWFCKTLQNWKAMIADLNENGDFFEVTFNGNKNEVYVNRYSKVSNTVVGV